MQYYAAWISLKSYLILLGSNLIYTIGLNFVFILHIKNDVTVA